MLGDLPVDGFAFGLQLGLRLGPLGGLRLECGAQPSALGLLLLQLPRHLLALLSALFELCPGLLDGAAHGAGLFPGRRGDRRRLFGQADLLLVLLAQLLDLLPQGLVGLGQALDLLLMRRGCGCGQALRCGPGRGPGLAVAQVEQLLLDLLHPLLEHFGRPAQVGSGALCLRRLLAGRILRRARVAGHE